MMPIVLQDVLQLFDQIQKIVIFKEDNDSPIYEGLVQYVPWTISERPLLKDSIYVCEDSIYMTIGEDIYYD